MEYKILDRINYPKDLKYLNIKELQELCNELRHYMIECCSKNPGHLGSSLGAVELIVALHYLYDTPSDKLVFDVGHQTYAHKILTGRKEIFKQNRKKEGISGFPKISESPYDAFGVGHSSTSISAALGFAEAYKIKGTKEKVVAIIGDGAMTGGMAYEGLNNAGDSNADILIILNDNNQSIDKNTGALHNYLLKITTAPSYNKIKRKLWDKFGDGKIRRCIQNLTRRTKSSLVSHSGGDFFQAMNLRYFGPIDGNNIEELITILSKIKDLQGPRILHLDTVKGKGYLKAEENPIVWHAPGKFDIDTGERLAPKSDVAKYQDVFGESLIELAKQDDKIIGITPAMSSGCGMNTFAEIFPKRFFDVGIEEEHAVTFSAGLARAGLTPFCNIYSSFSQRAYDQIIHDVALQSLPVIFCFDRAGLVGEDGATHHGCYDLSAYRSIPNMIISAPSNELELKNLMYTATLQKNNPFIIRYPRGKGEDVQWRNKEFEQITIGKGINICKGEKVAILALGPMVNNAKKAIEKAKKEDNIDIALYNMIFLKPIDTNILKEVSNKYESIITIEDACRKGGLYDEVLEYLAENNLNKKVKSLSIPDQFIEQDSQEGQRKSCKLDSDSIYDIIKECYFV